MAVEQSEGLSRLRVFDFAKGAWRELTFPEPIYTAFPGGTPEFNSPTFRVSYQSMVTPPSVYDYTLATLERKLMKQQEVLGGYDPANYVTERQWAPARDGVKVPISLVYKKGVPRDGTAPLLAVRLRVLRLRRVADVLERPPQPARPGRRLRRRAHPRRQRDGRGVARRRDVDEEEEHLHRLHRLRGVPAWRSGGPRGTGVLIEGGSAGGLLMGAVTNMRPDLFKAVHAAVPFVDVMNTMMDATLPLTVGEYLEWGNPNQKAAFDYMRSYSPYDNLERKAYPNILVTTSFNDSQVMYWEPAKYVAKLRTLKTDTNELLLKTQDGAGRPRRRLGPLRPPEGHGVRVRLDAEAGGDYEVGVRPTAHGSTAHGLARQPTAAGHATPLDVS